MKHEVLVDEVLPYLVTYLQDGRIQAAALVERMPAIDSIDHVLQIAIWKQRETHQLLHALPDAMRELRTGSDERQTRSPHIRGAIHWQQTIIEQVTQSRQHYVSVEVTHTQDVPENNVLFYVIITLAQWLARDNFMQHFETRNWYAPLKEALPQLQQAAVHLRTTLKKRVTQRQLQRVQQHRKMYYRLAATLYVQICAIEDEQYDAYVLRQALYEHLIVPTNEDVLFEWYWLVQILKRQQQLTMHMATKHTRALASWHTVQHDVALYYNNAGSSRTQFQTLLHELDGDHPYVTATRQQAIQYNEAASVFFQRKPSQIVWRGRPDFIIEYSDSETNKLVALVIGEVKYTVDEAYMKQGLQELLMYMHHVATDADVPIYGMLCVAAHDGASTGNVQIVSPLSSQPFSLPFEE